MCSSQLRVQCDYEDAFSYEGQLVGLVGSSYEQVIVVAIAVHDVHRLATFILMLLPVRRYGNESLGLPAQMIVSGTAAANAEAEAILAFAGSST